MQQSGQNLSQQQKAQPTKLQVVCMDYPRPELDNTVNYLEAAYFYTRSNKPLNVVISSAVMTKLSYAGWGMMQ
ncbi:hypothetical protein MKW98_000573 [Papaver atlanticum]|uniref:Uncharacterized protein n=1 Tax=Papaver atlanticum TaxID=357466 RepID=A0AAD4S4S0_9MAGN|nr:hypothetical protein MKW98_000573 [Papaver atlanticum]